MFNAVPAVPSADTLSYEMPYPTLPWAYRIRFALFIPKMPYGAVYPGGRRLHPAPQLSAEAVHRHLSISPQRFLRGTIRRGVDSKAHAAEYEQGGQNAECQKPASFSFFIFDSFSVVFIKHQFTYKSYRSVSSFKAGTNTPANFALHFAWNLAMLGQSCSFIILTSFNVYAITEAFWWSPRSHSNGTPIAFSNSDWRRFNESNSFLFSAGSDFPRHSRTRAP